MKTFARVLAILIAFTIMTGITYSAVSASGSSNNAPAFQRDGEGFAPRDGGQREFQDQDRGGGGFGLLFGLLKNTLIVAVIVVLIVLPRNFLQQKRRAVPVKIN